MLTIKNKSRQLFTLNLPPGLDYESNPSCASTERNFHLQAVTKDGDVGVREVTKRISGSLTWLSGPSCPSLSAPFLNSSRHVTPASLLWYSLPDRRPSRDH